MGQLFDAFTDATALYKAFQKSCIGSAWKGSVQGFGKYCLLNIYQLQKELKSLTYEQMPFVEFELHERGKARHIKSMHIRDRVVQRAMCDEVLAPCLVPALIYDNGASLEGKGVDFTRRRLQCHLEKFYRHHGSNGYILKIDFSKFFDNIDHELALRALKKRIDDPLVMEQLRKMIDAFAVDISALSDEEAKALENRPFDALTHKPSHEGKRFLRRSVGIGSQISQLIGIYFPTPIDFYCKTKRQCKYYGRYMDDIYIIHEDKAFLESVLAGILQIAEELRLFVNPRKTTITPLRAGFTFLKVRYSYTATGHVVKRLVSAAFARERRKLISYRRLLDEGRISRTGVRDFYNSFRGAAVNFASHRSIRKLDRFYNELFSK